MDRIMNKKTPKIKIDIVRSAPYSQMNGPTDYHGMVLRRFKPKMSFCERVMAFFN